MKIFILEDDPSRIEAFRFALNDHDVTICQWLKGKDGAYEVHQPPYDIYLLDHDLGGLQYVESDGVEETGFQFAQFMGVSPANRPIVIIHSFNPGGARKMGNLLWNQNWRVTTVPFGQTLLQYLKGLKNANASEYLNMASNPV